MHASATSHSGHHRRGLHLPSEGGACLRFDMHVSMRVCEECLVLADVANEAERYQGSRYVQPQTESDAVDPDVVKYIKTIVENYGAQLTIEERNLLSVAYKNITNNLRNSWRNMDLMEIGRAHV